MLPICGVMKWKKSFVFTPSNHPAFPFFLFSPRKRKRKKKEKNPRLFLLFFVRHWDLRHARGSLVNSFSRAPFAFKDSVIGWFCNWYHLSHFAAFFNEIGSQVIHRDTLWKPFTKNFFLMRRGQHVFCWWSHPKRRWEVEKNEVFFFLLKKDSPSERPRIKKKLEKHTPHTLTTTPPSINWGPEEGFFFFGYRKMIQLQVHLQLPCYDFCFLYWRNIG